VAGEGLRFEQDQARERLRDEALELANELAAAGRDDVERVLEETRERIDQLQQDRPSARFPVLTGDELFRAEETPIRWLLRPLFLMARQGVLFGPPGVGKSMLLRHLVGALLSDLTVFG